LAVETAPLKQPEADLSWLWSFIQLQQRSSNFALMSGVVGGLAAAFEPYLIGIVVDHVRRGVETGQLVRDILTLIAMSLVNVTAFWGQRYYSGQVAYGVNFDVRRTLFDNLLTLDQGYFHRYATGDLISRMYSDIDAIWRLLALGYNRMGSAVTTLVITFLLLSTVNLPLTLIVFTVLTISTSLQMRAGLRLAPVFEKVQEQAGTLAALVQDSVSGIQTIKTFGREAGVAAKFQEENNEYRRRWLFFKRRNEPVGMLPNMIAELTAGTVVLFGGLMTVSGAMTLGNFVQFLFYLNLISVVLLQIGTVYQRYQQTKASLTRLTPLLQVAEIRSHDSAQPLPNPRGDIRYENVGVCLDDQWLLRNINLEIPAGSVVAFVGPTGCGKTMLVNLLARVLDPNEGRVLIDGHDICKLDLDDLRQAIAYVPQSTFLFSQPLHQNVRMGRDDVNEEVLTRALHIARVSSDLPQLPRGLDTLVGEKGVMLSGGQKQRVAIARAIVRDPAILVLDDALSSVDTQTAADILGDLRQVLKSRTSLIIAHRIATVKDADFIVVMDEGAIVEVGTHQALIARDGLYARMVDRELRGEDEA
jgi:ATP-binding cassette, subfamily B, multidrug efflux pump